MPGRIRLQFDQAVDPALGAIRIAAADGREWTAEPASDTADARVVHAAAPRLPAGVVLVLVLLVAGFLAYVPPPEPVAPLPSPP